MTTLNGSVCHPSSRAATASGSTSATSFSAGASKGTAPRRAINSPKWAPVRVSRIATTLDFMNRHQSLIVRIMKVYTMRPHIAIFLVGLMILLRPATGHCWGDEGHEIVGLIAEHYLEPAVRTRAIALLAQDASGLTRGRGIAEATTWADKFRHSARDTTQQ